MHPQDVEGWKKLHEVLGSKCLLVADRTFDDLPITPLRKREDKETTEVDETDEGTQGREEGEAEEGLDFLSCAGISLENTLSATCSRALSLAGELPMYVCMYMYIHVACLLAQHLALPSQCAHIAHISPSIISTTLLSHHTVGVRMVFVCRQKEKHAWICFMDVVIIVVYGMHLLCIHYVCVWAHVYASAYADLRRVHRLVFCFKFSCMHSGTFA